jgi:hypothetical protein
LQLCCSLSTRQEDVGNRNSGEINEISQLFKLKSNAFQWIIL